MNLLQNKTNSFGGNFYSFNILKTGFFFLFFITFFSCNGKNKDSSVKIKIIDDTGHEVVLEHNPQKVISLAPNITEMLYALHCENELIGVTKWCTYPPEAKKKEIVGDLLSVSYEKIISLKPDLVFVTKEGNTREVFDKIESFGIKVFVTNPRNITGINKSIKDLSVIFGKEKIADSIIKSIQNKIDSVRNKIIQKPKVIIFVSLVPLMVVGGNTFLDEIISLAGGSNPFSEFGSTYPTINREEILKKNPDIILIPSDIMNDASEALKLYPEWRNTSSARNNSIYIVDADMTQRPGIRCGDAIIMMHKIFIKKK